MAIKIHFDTRSADDYRKFLEVRRMPIYRFVGTSAEVPDEYAKRIGEKTARKKQSRKYEPIAGMFDYQRDITATAIAKQKYAIFADCGLGKTLMLLEFAKQRGTLQDYLIKFRKPGENAVAIDAKNQVSRNDWIAWAEGCWDDIAETDTLNTAVAKSEDDTKHICPLQLEVIRRCVLLFSNPGELVFSPFAGIGSEGFMSLGGKSPKTGKCIHDQRRFYGCELKPEYHAQAIRNLELAVRQAATGKQQDLFAEVGT